MTNQNNAISDPIFPSSSPSSPPPPPEVSSLPDPTHHRKKRTTKVLLNPFASPPPLPPASSSSSLPSHNAAVSGSGRKNKAAAAAGGGGGGGGRKPDPSAPKITEPCTECGKRFSSRKALFGHMRCHPEREWRGINPPPNHRRRPPPQAGGRSEDSRLFMTMMTAEDHKVADCLLFLANYTAASSATCSYRSPVSTAAERNWENRAAAAADGDEIIGAIESPHQDLGGNRAGHEYINDTSFHGAAHLAETTAAVAGEVLDGGHKCSICLKVFPSGQALGGHKRGNLLQQGSRSSSSVLMVDLNLPAPAGIIYPAKDEEDEYSSPPTLDLRLGL